MDREELGQIVHRAWVRSCKKQENPKASWLVGWEELGEDFKEADRQIGEYVQKLVLEQFKGQVVTFDEEGVRVLMPNSSIVDLLEYLDKHRSEYSYERPQLVNLHNAVKDAVGRHERSELGALSKLKAFKDDVLTYLRAIALVAETVGNAETHREKNTRLRGLIAQIESAIARIRREGEQFVTLHWDKPDLFRSDYPVRRYQEKINELEAELRRLKGEPPKDDDGIF